MTSHSFQARRPRKLVWFGEYPTNRACAELESLALVDVVKVPFRLSHFTADEFRATVRSKTAGADGSVFRPTSCPCEITPELFYRANKPHFVFAFAKGTDNLKPLNGDEFRILNATGNEHSVASLVVQQALNHWRAVNGLDRQIRSGLYSNRPASGHKTFEGMRCGVLGAGELLSSFARHIDGHRAESICFYHPDPGRAEEVMSLLQPELSHVQLDSAVDASEAFNGCDLGAVMLPLSESRRGLYPPTKGLVDGDVLSALKDDAVLIDVSRPGIVDHEALIHRLGNSTFRAHLDILPFEVERTGMVEACRIGQLHQENSFGDRLTISPHVGGQTKQAASQISENLLIKIKKHFCLERTPNERNC